MNVIVVDDEKMAANNLELELKKLENIQIVGNFQNPIRALEYVEHNSVDVALLDIEMPGIGGIQLAEKLREHCKEMWIIFVTGYENYSIEAFRVKANGYLLKPTDAESIRREIDYARAQVEKPHRKSLFIKTFGNFDLFLDGHVVSISSAKAKELLAILVDRQGSSASLGQLTAILWEDKADAVAKGNFRVIINRLQGILHEYGIQDLLVHTKNQYSVDITMFDCDYYEFLSGDLNAIKQYSGEYMAAYTWAEETNAFIQNAIHEK